jgi:anti-sigma factor RsiW
LVLRYFLFFLLVFYAVAAEPRTAVVHRVQEDMHIDGVLNEAVWRANEDIAVEAVTSHVRATLGHQLIQVASSNQHTVKPWLSARLDYSPPVPDLKNEGFELVGGRVDYVDRHPVATLVYRIRDHNIDVFVRPESARAPPTALRTVRGFNVAHATGSGMDCSRSPMSAPTC